MDEQRRQFWRDNSRMNQQAIARNLCFLRTREMELLELMEGVVPWRAVVSQLTALGKV